MITRFFFRNRVGHIKARIKQLALILALALLIRVLMCRFDCAKWVIWNTVRLSRLGTEMLYLSLLTVSVSLYMLRLNRRNWKNLLTTAAAPLIFFMTFCYTNNLKIVIAYLALFMCMLFMDIKLIKDIYDDYEDYEDYEDLHREKREELEKLILEDLGDCIRFVGVFSTIAALLAWYPSSQVSGQHAQRDIVYATNMRDLETTTPTNLWEPNRYELQQLALGYYEQLDVGQRINALQGLLNIETEYLGCEPIILGVREMESAVGGYYDRTLEEIILNRSLLEDCEVSYDVIGVTLHEVYHYYSDCCVRELGKLEAAGVNMDLLFARDIRAWSAEQNDYISGSLAYTEDGFDPATYYAYSSQALETSAEEYSKLWLNAYWNYINSIE